MLRITEIDGEENTTPIGSAESWSCAFIEGDKESRRLHVYVASVETINRITRGFHTWITPGLISFGENENGNLYY